MSPKILEAVRMLGPLNNQTLPWAVAINDCGRLISDGVSRPWTRAYNVGRGTFTAVEVRPDHEFGFDDWVRIMYRRRDVRSAP